MVVHERPGEILRKQREIGSGDRAHADGADPSRPKTTADDVADRAAELAEDLEAMGPTFVKVGQFLSTRADLVPIPYLQALARLQDQVEPFSFSNVERIVTEELGVRVSKAFACFDDRPVTAASNDQVHRAEIHSGRVLYERELFGHQRFLAQLTVGTMPPAKVMHGLELLGTKVAPAVRSETTQPTK